MDRVWMSVYLISKQIENVMNNSDYTKEFKIDFAKTATKELKALAEHELDKLEGNP